jgi:hypothetical protein
MSSAYPPYGGPLMQRCVRCGAPLSPNVVTCANCGAYNPVAQSGGPVGQEQSPWAGSSPQTSLGSGSYPGSPWEQAPSAPLQNNQWGQSVVPPQNTPFGESYAPQSMTPPPNYYGMQGQGQQSNFNNYYATPQQNTYHPSQSATYEGYQSSSLNGYAPTSYDQPPQQRGGPRVGLIIGILVLVVILVGGAFAGYSYLKNRNQNGNASDATPVTVSTPSAPALFNDSFANSSSTGWDLTGSPGKFSVKVGGGSMILEDDDNKLLWEILPGKSFTDFRLDVDARLSKGDPNNGYGVFIRGASTQDSDLGTYYRFEVYGDGSYAIFKGSLDASGHTQSTKVQGYTTNASIAKSGQVNHITIIAKGPDMTLMINGQTLYTYSDNNYKGGSVALFVSNLPSLPGGAQATFTHLAIFPAT